MNGGRSLVAVVAAAGVALVGLYVALGGGNAGPIRIADPCEQRPWRDVDGVRQIGERIALSSLDGVACELGISREELTLIVADDGDLERFMRQRNITDDRLDALLRLGLRRAVQDGRNAGALGAVEAFLLGQAIDRLPIDRVVDTYRSGNLDWITIFL